MSVLDSFDDGAFAGAYHADVGWVFEDAADGVLGPVCAAGGGGDVVLIKVVGDEGGSEVFGGVEVKDLLDDGGFGGVGG